MQTFLPYKSFTESAACLDYRRLGKQRVEAYQILQTLLGINKGWANHPAVRMWCGYELALTEYGIACCTEWKARGYVDNLLQRFRSLLPSNQVAVYPKWLTSNFIRSHRSNLLRKNPIWYNQFKWRVGNDLPYVWPVNKVVDINCLTSSRV